MEKERAEAAKAKPRTHIWKVLPLRRAPMATPPAAPRLPQTRLKLELLKSWY
jgi:hypothetical protein